MTENALPPVSFEAISSNLGIGYLSGNINLFMVFLKSAHIRTAPVGFTTNTTGDAQITGSSLVSIGFKTPFSTKRSSSHSTTFFRAKGTGRGFDTTGTASGDM